MKATYGEVIETQQVFAGFDSDPVPMDIPVGREIFKDPITDDGTKKSAKGLLRVEKEEGVYKVYDQQKWEQEKEGELETIFLDGQLLKDQTLEEIRARIKAE